MALTEFQRDVCRLLAAQRIRHGEAYVAGGVALNTLTGGRRQSRDIDVFHDTREAVQKTWEEDRNALSAASYGVTVLLERPTFVEARVDRDTEQVVIQWAQDSAFRFFPLIQHEDLGLALHPFDLATNKVLALVGRLEVRDWVDVIHCDEEIQPFGYLVWAACGKDPGLNPSMILEEAGRSARYTVDEVAELAFEGPAPDAGQLSCRWKKMLAAARDIIDLLPSDRSGMCVLDPVGQLFRGNAGQLKAAVSGQHLGFHAGCVRGAFPRVVSQ